MEIFLTVFHVMICLVLIVTVLIQQGKGADIGAVFGGGGSNTVFGSRGAGNFLSKITTGAAITFMLTSLALSYLANQDASDRIFDAAPATEEGGFEELPTGIAPIPEDELGAFEEVDPPAPASETPKAAEVPEAPIEETPAN